MSKVNLKIMSPKPEAEWLQVEGSLGEVRSKLNGGRFVEFDTENGKYLVNSDQVIWAEAAAE